MLNILSELKNSYLEVANRIPGWEKMSQIELGNLYSTDTANRDAYLAAIAVRYWNILSKALYLNNHSFTEEEAYDWFTDALLYTLETQQWKNPKSTVYNDPKAIEKMLNTCFHSSKANWFQASNRYKRKINHSLFSLDCLKEDFADCFEPVAEDNDILEYSIKDLVYKAFRDKQYLFSLMLDLIVNDIELGPINNDKSLISAIKKSIKSLPDDYVYSFSSNYNLDSKLVENSFKLIYNMSDDRLTKSIEGYIYKLRSIFRRDK